MKASTLSSALLHASAAGGIFYASEFGTARPFSTLHTEHAPISIAWAHSLEEKDLEKKTNQTWRRDDEALPSPKDHKDPMDKSKPSESCCDSRSVSEVDGTSHKTSTALERRASSSNIQGREVRTRFFPSPYNEPLLYPEHARTQGVEGQGTLRLDLTSDGTVDNVTGGETLPLILKKYATRILYSWKFEGELPPFVDVPVSFCLKN